MMSIHTYCTNVQMTAADNFEQPPNSRQHRFANTADDATSIPHVSRVQRAHDRDELLSFEPV